MLFLCSALQLASYSMIQSTAPVFCWGGTTLSVTFIHLFLSFFHSLHPSSRSPAACFFILSPPASLSHTSSPLTLTKWSHSSYASASKFSRIIEFLSGSYPQGVDVTALMLPGVNVSWLSALLCSSGTFGCFLTVQFNEITLICVGCMIHLNDLYSTANHCRKNIPLLDLRPLNSLYIQHYRKKTLDHL